MATKHGYKPLSMRHIGVKRTKSHSKYKKAAERYIDLLKKEKKEGLTKWISFAKARSVARLTSYGISVKAINNKLIHK